MTHRERLRRRALIKLLAESTGPLEQGSDAQLADRDDVRTARARAEAAGAAWVAQHRGIIGWDKYPMPRSRGLHHRLG